MSQPIKKQNRQENEIKDGAIERRKENTGNRKRRKKISLYTDHYPYTGVDKTMETLRN
jgi:hypothetical protein